MVRMAKTMMATMAASNEGVYRYSLKSNSGGISTPGGIWSDDMAGLSESSRDWRGGSVRRIGGKRMNGFV